MSTKETGGPAFPHIDSGCGRFDAGMTLRDYFAAKAMQGMLTTSAGPCLNGLGGYEDITSRAAYKLADAMLKAREA